MKALLATVLVSEKKAPQLNSYHEAHLGIHRRRSGNQKPRVERSGTRGNDMSKRPVLFGSGFPRSASRNGLPSRNRRPEIRPYLRCNLIEVRSITLYGF